MRDFIIKYWLQTLFSGFLFVLVGVGRRLWRRAKKEWAEQQNIKNGMLAILHDRLYNACQYYIHAGELTISELENIKYLYDSYSILGGNGTCTELYNRCCKLRILPLGQYEM